ncbi:anaphase-promoting complex subunit 13 [Arctopsyche grandis]|uniref:anaphase-promoting complex subunit 13 n=1 Tax=Arctopsyche grandis TaxID=121162 RepID=UPI00406D75A8
MDSIPIRNGRLIDAVDDAWREDELPHDDVLVPIDELPDPEADSADSHLTLKEQTQKWQDVAPNFLAEQTYTQNN